MMKTLFLIAVLVTIAVCKLDETNNECYKYVYSQVPTLQDTDANYRRFIQFDADSDGILSQEEATTFGTNLGQTIKDSPKYKHGTTEYKEKMDTAIVYMEEAVVMFFLDKGVDPVNGLKREDWIEANQCFALAECIRKERGEASKTTLLSDAYFAVLDVDENGTIDVDELKRMMIAAFGKTKDAKATKAANINFKKVDKDSDKKLDRSEFRNLAG